MARSLKKPEAVADIDGKPIGAVLVGVRARQTFKNNNLREIARQQVLGSSSTASSAELTKVQINLDTTEELNPVITESMSIDPYTAIGDRELSEEEIQQDALPPEDLPGPNATSIPAPTPPPPPAAAKKAPTPVTTQTRNTVSTSRTATSARSVPSAAPAKPAAGNLTRQQYDAAVTNLARINQDLAAAQNQLNTLYRNRNPRNAAQIKALGTTIARLKSQAASAKQTVDRLKKSI
jgi:hypothetical protein